MTENEQFDIRVQYGKTKADQCLRGDAKAIGANPLISLRAELTNKRNREPDKAERERLTTLINNMDGLIRDPADDALQAQFARNVAAYEARRAGRA